MKLTHLIKSIVIAAAALAGASTLHAQEITFDDLEGPFGPVTSGYGNLEWTNVYFVNPVNVWLAPTGYQAGTVSGTNVATGIAGDPFGFSSTVTPFNLDYLYLTGAWNEGVSVEITGYRNGTQLYSLITSLSSTQPTLVQPGFSAIDTVLISSFGGTPNTDYYAAGGGGTEVAVDNIHITPVPEPSTYGLIGAAGLAGLGLYRRRSRQA